MRKAEEELGRLRQSESSCRTRLQLVERHCARVTEESKEFSETVQQLEQINRHLRTELTKALQSRPMDETQPIIMLKHRIEMLVAHNRRLRDKIDELTSSDRKHVRLKKVQALNVMRASEIAVAVCIAASTPFCLIAIEVVAFS
ncbi:unnamed protein product [Gongylonema pulchrum]|uniref:Uncharacterized protein n=1 Tax=Gongylonema pulchrum TaxID=637853 RepID=A0A183D5P5_9BILA|nr:unnamed protein product [Gongylonema pulchrum]